MNRRGQDGAVLLVALLIVAIATTLASFAVQRQDAAIRRLEAARDHDQARWILIGGVQWARAILAEDARSGQLDHARELWASPLKATEVEDATLTGSLQDEQGLFNLAGLVHDGRPSPRRIEAFRRLLRAIDQPPTLADAIAAAQPMTEWSQLLDVPGCDERTLARLARVATLLPAATPVNVNTAPAAVLLTLVDGLEAAEASVLANSLRTAPAASVAEFSTRLPRPDLRVEDADLAVTSRFFKVHGHVTLRNIEVRIEALLQRQGTAWPEIVWSRTS